jgi:hypothetical protein
MDIIVFVSWLVSVKINYDSIIFYYIDIQAKTKNILNSSLKSKFRSIEQSYLNT